jgi:hypothetical protein
MKRFTASQGRFDQQPYYHALEILSTAFPTEYDQLCEWMETFTFQRSEIESGGGARSNISKRIDDFFLARGWSKKNFDIGAQIDGKVTSSETHTIDNYKNKIGIEVEWNNKTEFFDRDLNNFRHLHQHSALSVGVIITRSSSLQTIFNDLGIGKKYGASTTHFDKLLQKAERGLAGTCPLIILGIKKECYRP